MEYKKGTLPCLRSVDENWSEEDRLLLFYYLKNIFHVDYDYFATLPSCNLQGMDVGTRKEITREDMENFENAIVGDNKKISCAKIQKGIFSFGAYNKHLCYLCPYSGQYKNLYEGREKEVLYYQLGFYTLHDILEDAGVKISQIIKSYYPIVQDGVLKDAMPLSTIADLFVYEQFPLIEYKDNRENVDIENLSKIESIMNNKFAYKIKKKPYYVTDDEAYLNTMIRCSQEIYLEIVNLNKSPLAYTRQIKDLDRLNVLDKNLLTRQINVLLEKQPRYKAKSVEEYKVVAEIQKEDPLLPSFVKDNYRTSELEKVQGRQEKEEVHNADYKEVPKVSSKIREGDETTQVGDGVFSEDPKPVQSDKDSSDFLLEEQDTGFQDIIDHSIETADGFDNRRSYDDGLLSMDEFDRYISTELQNQDAGKTDFVDTWGKDGKRTVSDCFEQNCLDGVSWLTDLGRYENYEDLFKELSEKETICIEPASKDSVKGLLLAGGDRLVFYCGDLYGNKLFLKLMKAGCDFYTTHLLEVSRYLHRIKIYDEKIHDLRIAAHCSSAAFESFTKKPLRNRMKRYKTEYEDLLSKDQKVADNVYLMEKFCSVISSDGQIPPFKGLDCLYTEDAGGNLVSCFTGENVPEKKGVFYLLSLAIENLEGCMEDLDIIYKKVCVELNRYLKFAEGVNFLLGADYRGILLYATGNEMDREDAGTYLKACARRTVKEIYGVQIKFDIRILHQYVNV